MAWGRVREWRIEAPGAREQHNSTQGQRFLLDAWVEGWARGRRRACNAAHTLPPPLVLSLLLPATMRLFKGAPAPCPASAPTPADLRALAAAVDAAHPTAHARLLKSGEPGLGAISWDDRTLMRWLVAEEGSVERAAARLGAHAEWRAALLPDGWTLDKGEMDGVVVVGRARGRARALARRAPFGREGGRRSTLLLLLQRPRSRPSSPPARPGSPRPSTPPAARSWSRSPPRTRARPKTLRAKKLPT